MPKFNSLYCEKLRETINSSPIFHEEPEVKKHYNLLLVSIDRISDSIDFLNKFLKNSFKKDEDFIIFLTFACMIRDAVISLYNNIGLKYKYNDKGNDDNCKYFYKLYSVYKCLYNQNLSGKFRDDCGASYCLSNNCPIYENGKLDDCPTDDNFFEYLRSLIFAHPFETNRHKFREKGEIQFSPWVFIGHSKHKFDNPVGLRIYTNKFDNFIDLEFSLNILFNYLNSRLILLEGINEWAKNKIKDYENIWAKRKVNRNLTPVEILKDIRSILIERHEDHFEIDSAIKYLEFELTNNDNFDAVLKYKNNLIKEIPQLCNDIDSVNRNNYLTESFLSALEPRPGKLNDDAKKQLQDIFVYLNDDKDIYNIEWGIKQAMTLYDAFAREYIVMNPNMCFTEIKILINSACFLEKINQEQGIINKNISHLIDQDNEQKLKIKECPIIDTMKIESCTIEIRDFSGKHIK